MKDTSVLIPTVLIRLGAAQHKVGYIYLKDIITILNDGEKSTTLTDAYRMTANKHNITVNAVECSARRVAKEIIKNASTELKTEIFGYDIVKENKLGRDYYTVGEFVLYILSYINSKK